MAGEISYYSNYSDIACVSLIVRPIWLSEALVKIAMSRLLLARHDWSA
jgi:hypothetical protein